MVTLLFQNKSPLCEYNKATITRHNYSTWQRPGNLKTETSVFEIEFWIETVPLEKARTDGENYVQYFKVIFLF